MQIPLSQRTQAPPLKIQEESKTKLLALCEGDTDIIFLEELFKEMRITKQPKYFVKHRESGSPKNDDETLCIRSFCQHSQKFHEKLIKNEGGKTEIKKVFSSIALSVIMHKDIRMVIMPDLDSESIDSYIKKCGAILQTRRRDLIIDKTGESVICDGLKPHQFIRTSEVSVKVSRTGENLGKFLIVAFSLTLEQASGIDKKSDKEMEKRAKCSKLLKNEAVFKVLSEIFG